MNPNKEKKYNSFLEQYCKLYDLYEMILAIDSQLKVIIEIKDILYDFYDNSTYEMAKKELEKLVELLDSYIDSATVVKGLLTNQ